jgi:hypothetical protein
MTAEEKEKVLTEIEILKTLLDFHVNNRSFVTMGDKEFEEYVNAVLDRLNELKELVDENEGTE